MNQTSPSPLLFQRLWRVLRYFLLGLMVLVVLYAVARVIDVSLGSVYSGIRGPYLQMPSDTAITVRWQSKEKYPGTVRYGRDRDRLEKQATERVAQIEHRVRIKGLMPLTKYYYRIVSKTAGLDKTYSFVTAASPGSDAPLRFWVTGDEGYRRR